MSAAALFGFLAICSIWIAICKKRNLKWRDGLVLSGIGFAALCLIGGTLIGLRIETGKFAEWPDPYSPVSVIRETFRNEVVPVDGFSYSHSTLENVTLLYNGTTPPQLSLNTFRGTINIESENPAVVGAWALLKGVGAIREGVDIDFGPKSALEPMKWSLPTQ